MKHNVIIIPSVKLIINGQLFTVLGGEEDITKSVQQIKLIGEIYLNWTMQSLCLGYIFFER